jgi:hypothetical protein
MLSQSMRHMLYLLAGLLPCLALCQAPAPTPPTELSTLQALAESTTSLRDQITTLQTKAKAGDATAAKELDGVQQRLAEAQRNFETVATGVDRTDFEGRSGPVKLDLASEFNELLQPFMNEVKSATEQPRIIEGLRGQVVAQQRKRQLVDRAIESLDEQLKLLAKPKDGSPELALKRQLQALRDKWQTMQKQTDATQQAAEHQLAETLAKRKTLWEILTDAVRLFFLTRGRNFLLALLAIFGSLFCWRWIYRRVIRRSPWHQRQGDKPFIARAFDVACYISGIGFAIIAALTVLYSTGDWLLLGLCLISIIGLGLAARTALPKYYRQGRLMLNLGEVREGERVVFAGLSWIVKSLGPFSTLHNPCVRNGTLRVPLTSLTTLTSRPHTQGEPWFPCKEEDWVQLTDSTFGKVVCITPEFVQIVQLGGAHKTYPTAKFLTENPINYAGGFRLTSILRLDHSQRSIVTEQIPGQLCRVLKAGLCSIVSPDELRSLKAEYRLTTPVALEIEVLADFAGSVADQLPALQRALQRYALEASQQHNWQLASQVVQLGAAS